MPSVYTFSGDVDYHQSDEWDDDLDEEVAYQSISFARGNYSNHTRQSLLLSRRESQEDSGRLEGPIGAFVDGDFGSNDGVVAAVLGRGYLHITLSAEAAASVEDDEVRVEFELGDEQFEMLRDELNVMFAGLDTLRVEVQ